MTNEHLTLDFVVLFSINSQKELPFGLNYSIEAAGRLPTGYLSISSER